MSHHIKDCYITDFLIFFCLCLGVQERKSECCVPECKSKAVTYHTWPKNASQSQIWTKNIFHQHNIPPNLKWLKVCSSHFDAKDFTTSLRPDILRSKVRPKLVKDAVPTIFEELSKGSSSAIEKLTRKRHVQEAISDHKSKMSKIENERTSDIGCQTDLSMRDIENMCNAKSKTFTADQVCQGLILKSISRKAFEYVKHNKLVNLPSLRTQRRWLSDFKIEPGLNNHFLDIVQKSLAGKESYQKQTILSFDEVDLKEVYEYDSRLKQVYGDAKKMQCVMARGLFDDWKQIIFFDFKTNMTLELLNKIIIACEEHGLGVRGVCFDLGNHTFLKDTGIIGKLIKINHK